jgi:type II secretory pathway pseudopilin PulG
MTRQRSESGETLLEIIMALVIIGLVVSAYFATYSTSALGSTSQRDLVTADGLLRRYAEAIKGAVRHDCASSTTYTTTSTSTTLPANFLVTVSPVTQSCPAATTVQPFAITVQLPNQTTRSLSTEVRSP